MRASQRPGAASSAGVGIISGPGPQPVELLDTAPLHDAAAERDADVVVTAIELETEQPVDERGRFTAVEPVSLQRLVDTRVGGDHRFAERLDDDVGVPSSTDTKRCNASSTGAWRSDRIAPSSALGIAELRE